MKLIRLNEVRFAETQHEIDALIDEGFVETSETVNLSKLKLDELKKIAAEREIEIPEGATKKDILAIIEG